MEGFLETFHSSRMYSDKSRVCFKWILEDYRILEDYYKKGIRSPKFSITESEQAFLTFMHVNFALHVQLSFPDGLEIHSMLVNISLIDGRNDAKFVTKTLITSGRKIMANERFSLSMTRPYDILIPESWLHDDTLTLLCEITIIKFVKSTPISTFQRTSLRDICTKNVFDESANSKNLYDVSFMVKSTTSLAHKLVLGMRSKIFKLVLEDHAIKSTKAFDVQKYNAATFEAFLKFMITGMILDNEKVIGRLLILAHEYQLTSLLWQCEKYIIQNVTNANVIKYLLIARTHKFVNLERACVEFAKMNFKQLFATPENFYKLIPHLDLFLQMLQ